ncbi:hypothetical protein [Burkholderia pseudomallei]|uniref:hypothetical protein n=1 Tax=Burkholderia pseudomallei TaxID=28450 RepID=UPI001E42123C|nr:hypothetical protein [Burkholderia pseudomallei]
MIDRIYVSEATLRTIDRYGRNNLTNVAGKADAHLCVEFVRAGGETVPKWVFDNLINALQPAWDYIQTHQDQFGAIAGDDKNAILVEFFLRAAAASEAGAQLDAELDARLADGDRIIEELASIVRAPAQAPEPVAIPDEATFQRLFIKHGGPVDFEGWCLNESGLRDFLRELAAAPQPTAQADAPAEARPTSFHFHRFVDGQKMAEDVLIERERTLDAAIRAAVRSCPKRPLTVLVHAPALRGALADARVAQADARGEDAYVAKRLSEALADVYTTLIGDDKVDADDKLNAIERVERAAQVLRLEVELYRAKAEAQKATRACTCPSGDGSLRWPCRTHSSQQVPSAGALTDEQIDAIWNDTDTRCCASLAEARRYFARALLTAHIQGSRK